MNVNPLFSLKSLKISHRLIGGFAILVILLVASSVATLWNARVVQIKTDQIVNLRIPTSQASGEMMNHINTSLASLRGWMLTGNPKFKTERAGVWKSIGKVARDMDGLSSHWTDSENVLLWKQFKAVLQEFSDRQNKVELIAKTPDEQPATKMLTIEAAPRAAVMVNMITKMIDLELAGDQAAGDRVKILGMMADVRGTLGLSLANIRAYLLTGDNKFVEKYNRLWTKNERRFKDLSNAVSLMSPDQKKHFNLFANMRKEFTPLPAKMFAIRGSQKWNMANFLLVRDAVPLAGKLLTILSGPVQADGLRLGGMVANQRKLLTTDANATSQKTRQLVSMQWILLVMGTILGGVIAMGTIRSIVPPVVRMTAVMRKLARGDHSVEIPSLDCRDEIGDMASSVEVFKNNAIKNQREEELKAQDRYERDEQRAAMDKVTSDFSTNIEGIVHTVSSASAELNATAQSMTGISQQTSNQASEASQASRQTSGNVQAVATATEEMTSTIGEISQQVAEASSASRLAVEDVVTTSEQMNALAETANKNW